jgi:hypothetical protein
MLLVALVQQSAERERSSFMALRILPQLGRSPYTGKGRGDEGVKRTKIGVVLQLQRQPRTGVQCLAATATLPVNPHLSNHTLQTDLKQITFLPLCFRVPIFEIRITTVPIRIYL